MSELLGNDSMAQPEPQEIPDGKFETDVKGVFADEQLPGPGGTKQPVFTVDKKDFYNNLTAARQRMRFSTEAPVSQYMRGTKHKQPFHVQYVDGNQTYRRKVK